MTLEDLDKRIFDICMLLDVNAVEYEIKNSYDPSSECVISNEEGILSGKLFLVNHILNLPKAFIDYTLCNLIATICVGYKNYSLYEKMLKTRFSMCNTKNVLKLNWDTLHTLGYEFETNKDGVIIKMWENNELVFDLHNNLDICGTTYIINNSNIVKD